MTVVEVRSYSSFWGNTSTESETKAPGSAARRISPVRRSWSGFAKEWR